MRRTPQRWTCGRVFRLGGVVRDAGPVVAHRGAAGRSEELPAVGSPGRPAAHRRACGRRAAVGHARRVDLQPVREATVDERGTRPDRVVVSIDLMSLLDARAPHRVRLRNHAPGRRPHPLPEALLDLAATLNPLPCAQRCYGDGPASTPAATRTWWRGPSSASRWPPDRRARAHPRSRSAPPHWACAIG
jgi:hypothetical protein